MKSPIIEKVEDKILDYSDIENYNKATKVKTHIASLYIKDWSCQLVNLYRIILTSFIPTKRLYCSQVNHTDTATFTGLIKLRCEDNVLDSTTPLGKVELKDVHNFGFRNPIKIRYGSFKYNNSETLLKYNFNDVIMEMPPRESIHIIAEVQEARYIDTKLTKHKFCKIFARPEKEYRTYNENGVSLDEIMNADFEYCSGLIQFIYQDSMNLKSLMGIVKNILLEYFQEILDNYESHFMYKGDEIVFKLYNDSSTIIANAIFIYLYDISGNKINISVEKPTLLVSSIIRLTLISTNIDNTKKMMKTAIENIISHINQLNN